jgi:tRNA (guanine37-N1)-methyltransferase
MKLTIITLFPDMFKGFLQESIIKKAQEKGLVEINVIQLRDYARDNHKTVDERPYGGGAGMLLLAEPVLNAVRTARDHEAKAHVVLTSPRGVVYSQQKAQELSGKEHLIIVAGHYEGFDERISKEIDEEISIGDYVLTGGELPAAVIADSVTRLLPGVLKKEEATEVESFFTVPISDLQKAVDDDSRLTELQNKGVHEVRLLEYPQYTRPQDFEGESVPDILLQGHHAQIEKWRLQQAYALTMRRRPDLLSAVHPQETKDTTS